MNFSVLVPVEYELFEATVSFYRDTLELPVLERGESDAGNPWCQLQVSETTLTIHTGRDGKFPYPEFRPTGHGVAFAFEVQSIEEAVERLHRNGLAPLNRWEYEDGTESISVAAPAGNISELWSEE